MLKRLPLIPTLVVLIAAGVMVRMGFWQLERLHQKQALLAQYAVAGSTGHVLSDGDLRLAGPADAAKILYRRATFTCGSVTGWQAVSGTNRQGESGIAHVARCISPNAVGSDGHGPVVDIVLGWSVRPGNPDWSGGTISGVVSPGGELGFRIVADPSAAGLGQMATPDPASIPNNHLSYAFQWFAFALTALVIYGLALRKRLNP